MNARSQCTPRLRPAARHAARRRTLLLPAALLLCHAAGAQSQADGRWHGEASIGGSSASGNTRATTAAVRAETERLTNLDKISLRGLANYGSSQTNGVRTRSADLKRAAGRYERNFGERMFAFGAGEGEVDRPGGLDWRRVVTVGGGLRVVRTPSSTFDLSAGVGHTRARYTDGSLRAGGEILLGEESSHKVGASTSFRQRLAVYSDRRQFAARTTFDANLATAIVFGWTMNTGLAVRYQRNPPPGAVSTDSLVTFGFGYKY